MEMHSSSQNILICPNINWQSLADIYCIITVTYCKFTVHLLYIATQSYCTPLHSNGQHCTYSLSLFPTIRQCMGYCPALYTTVLRCTWSGLTLNGTVTNCMYAYVRNKMNFLFLNAYLKPKYGFVLNYFYSVICLPLLLHPRIQKYFQGGDGGMGKICMFFFDNSGFRPTVEPSLFVEDQWLWLSWVTLTHEIISPWTHIHFKHLFITSIF